MKVFFISITFTLFYVHLIVAQTPLAPLGTTWYFEFDTSPPFIISRTVEAIDTIQGQSCSVFTIGTNQEYVYKDSNKVYVFNAPTDQFYPIYDFSLEKGDTMKVYYSSSGVNTLDSLTFKIDAVNLEIIGGKEIKTQHISTIYNKSGLIEYGPVIYEDVGNIWGIFPGSGFISPPPIIRCKIVPGDEENSYRFTEDACDFISSTKELSPLDAVNIYPNPTSSTFQIDLPEELVIDHIELIDFSGRSLWRQSNWIDRQQEFMLPAATGIYTVAIHAAQTVILKKVVRL